jgi:hypothetical protein
MFSPGPCRAVFQYHITLLDCFDTICNDVRKEITTYALSFKKTSHNWSSLLPRIAYKAVSYSNEPLWGLAPMNTFIIHTLYRLFIFSMWGGIVTNVLVPHISMPMLWYYLWWLNYPVYSIWYRFPDMEINHFASCFLWKMEWCLSYAPRSFNTCLVLLSSYQSLFFITYLRKMSVGIYCCCGI